MSVNIRRFVNLNISRIKRNATNPVRDTVAVFGTGINLGEGVTSAIFTSGNYAYDKDNQVTGYVIVGKNAISGAVVEVTIAKADFTSANGLYTMASNFFRNGGAKLHVYLGTCAVEHGKLVVTNGSGDKAVKNIIPDEEIAVAGLSMTSTALNTLAKDYNDAMNPINPTDDASIANINTSANKVFAGYIDDDNLDDLTNVQENLCVKHSAKPGIQGTMLAYLSRINVYGENTVHDYNFTQEDVDEANVTDSDELVGNCIKNNINIDCVLAKAIRNVGGNLATGFDLVNYYCTIIMQQTVEEAIMNVLSDKLSGAEGTAVIYNAAVMELNKYVRCGLMSAGNWEPVDWAVEYEGEEYIVANANERLANGYKLLVIPFSAMPQEQIASHACPPIYVAMTNAYGIRKVTLNGEVR